MNDRPPKPGFHPSTDRRALLAGIGGLAAGTFLAQTARAGELTPPPGPIGPTMKRLDEIEPRIPIGPETTPGAANAVHRILQSGSYYLTGDVIGEPSKHGIFVLSTTSEVVIDLNGFTLRGVSGSFAGVFGSTAGPRIVIRNGQIRGWAARGVNAAGSVVLEDLRVEDNQLGGAGSGAGIASQVRRCSFINNTGYGLSVGVGSLVESVLSANNKPAPTIEQAGDGIIVGADSVVERCVARLNSGSGISGPEGFVASSVRATGNGDMGFNAGTEQPGTIPTGGKRAIVENCTADENGESGFALGPGSVINSCIAQDNGGVGIFAGQLQAAPGGGSHITDSTVQRNGRHGIYAGVYATIARCTALGNGIDQGDFTWAGIVGGVGSRIMDCTAGGNNGSGISTPYGVTVSECNCLFNTGNGISVSFNSTVSNCNTRGNVNGITFGITTPATGNCIISRNNCYNPTEAGIKGVGFGSRIVDNNCTNGGTGILIESPGSGNFIARNVCRANTTNWNIAANNKCLVVNGTNAGAINGDSGGVSPGSVDPNANFTY